MQVRRLWHCCCSALAGPGGCSKKIQIVQLPEFYSPKLKTIAVVPFRNHSSGRNAGKIISDELATAFMANGTYEVFNRNDLKAVMDEKDLQIALGSDTSAAAGTFKKSARVQAILTGSVTSYSATSNTQRRQRAIYGTDRRGNSYIQGYIPYDYTRNEANISVAATMIRVSDEAAIHVTPVPAQARVYSEGSPPSKDPYACISEATSRVVAQLVEHKLPQFRIL